MVAAPEKWGLLGAADEERWGRILIPVSCEGLGILLATRSAVMHRRLRYKDRQRRNPLPLRFFR